MTSELSKTNLIKPPKPLPNLKRPESIWNLNMQEAYDKFQSSRIDGLKIVSIVKDTIASPPVAVPVANSHIVAFYKWTQVLIPIYLAP